MGVMGHPQGLLQQLPFISGHSTGFALKKPCISPEIGIGCWHEVFQVNSRARKKVGAVMQAYS